MLQVPFGYSEYLEQGLLFKVRDPRFGDFFKVRDPGGEFAKVLLRSGKVRESRWSPRCGLRSPVRSRGPHAPGAT